MFQRRLRSRPHLEPRPTTSGVPLLPPQPRVRLVAMHAQDPKPFPPLQVRPEYTVGCCLLRYPAQPWLELLLALEDELAHRTEDNVPELLRRALNAQ